MCNFKGKDWEDDFGKTLSYEDFYTGIKMVRCLLPAKLMNIGLKKNLKNY